MRRWYYDEPTDYSGSWSKRVVYDEQMILEEHHDFFVNEIGPYETELTDPMFVDESVIEDWIICNWASPTDMPPGIYITASHPWIQNLKLNNDRLEYEVRELMKELKRLHAENEAYNLSMENANA